MFLLILWVLAFVISGMLSYCDRYSEGMKRVLKTFGPIPEFSGATVEKVNQVRRPLLETRAGRGEALCHR